MDCTGQKPASGLLQTLSPSSVTDSGHIRVRPTLQVDDDELSHVYACGDVADRNLQTPNGRSAANQGSIAADNIIASIFGRKRKRTYDNNWADNTIKLTLGLVRFHFIFFFSFFLIIVTAARMETHRHKVERHHDEFLTNQSIKKKKKKKNRSTRFCISTMVRLRFL